MRPARDYEYYTKLLKAAYMEIIKPYTVIAEPDEVRYVAIDKYGNGGYFIVIHKMPGEVDAEIGKTDEDRVRIRATSEEEARRKKVRFWHFCSEEEQYELYKKLTKVFKLDQADVYGPYIASYFPIDFTEDFEAYVEQKTGETSWDEVTEEEVQKLVTEYLAQS